MGLENRNILVGEITYEGRPFVLINAHLAWGMHGEYGRLNAVERIDEIAIEHSTFNNKSIICLAGDLNASDEARSIRFLHGLDLGLLPEHSTHWTDAYKVSGNKSQWATTDQGSSYWGKLTGELFDVVDQSFVPARRVDYIMTYGWNYGRIGCPVDFGRFGAPLDPESTDLSDHFGIWADILV